MSTPTLVEALQLVADALDGMTLPTEAAGLTVRATPYPPTGGDRRAGDAWVIPPRVTPATFTDARVELQAVLVLGSDPARAGQLYAALCVPVLNAVTRIDGLPVADVAVTPESLLAGEQTTAPLFVLTVSATAEVA